jgi:hypothetical protein
LVQKEREREREKKAEDKTQIPGIGIGRRQPVRELGIDVNTGSQIDARSSGQN